MESHRAWTPNEVLVGAIVRGKASGDRYVITGVQSGKIYIGGNNEYLPGEVLEQFEVFIGGDWKPCGFINILEK